MTSTRWQDKTTRRGSCTPRVAKWRVALRDAKPEMDAAQRSVILADCFADYRKERAAQRTAADTWLRAYIRDYASRAKAKLGPEEQKQLEASMAALQL